MSDATPSQSLPRTYRKRRPATRRRIVRLLRLGVGTFAATLCLLVVATSVRKASGKTDMPPPMPLVYDFIPSPNYDDRPISTSVSCIVLHSTVVNTMEGTINTFLPPVAKVSAHFIVGRNGRVVQMVPIEKRAWHAGVSVLEGAEKVNDYSVGIEMVNLNDGIDPYPDAQIRSVAGIIRFVRSRYNVPDSRIVSHAQIALPPGRKSDPASFDFERVRTLAKIEAPVPDAVTPAAPIILTPAPEIPPAKPVGN